MSQKKSSTGGPKPGSSSSSVSQGTNPTSRKSNSKSSSSTGNESNHQVSSSNGSSANTSSSSPSPLSSSSSKSSHNKHQPNKDQFNHTQQKFHQSLLYAVILLGLVYLAFFKGSLVDDPESTMIQTIPIIIILQMWYCASGVLDGSNYIGTVSTGSGGSGSSSSLSSHKETKRRLLLQQQQQQHYESKAPVSSALISTVLSLMMSVLVFGLLILFGAPASTGIYGTFLCAVHISLLSVLPLVYVYNLDSNTWKDIISVKLPLNGVYGASVGTWVGAWLGAIPIPLDWDRPWQQWPITILAGSYLGTAVGTLIGAAYRKFNKK